MLSLGLPHLTVLSKCDLFEDKEKLELFLNLEYNQKVVDLGDDSHIRAFNKHKGNVDAIFEDPDVKKEDEHPRHQKIKFNEKYEKLSQRIRGIVTDYNLVSLLPLDVNDHDSISDIIYHADHNIQFGEEREANENAIKEVEKRMGNVQFD
jgi:hypothetical protein